MDILCEEVLSISRTSRLVNPSQDVPALSAGTFNACLSRLLSGEPLQYVLGFADFYGHRFRVSPSVLIPRPETELLCDKAISLVRSRPRRRLRILDLCTGSGCIAWTMAAAFPDAEVAAVDISEEALAVARSQNICPNTPVFIRADVLSSSLPDVLLSSLPDALSRPSAAFDVVLSNPPYVMESEKPWMRRNVLEHEPDLALFVPDEDPLVFYRAIASCLPRLLNPGGFCLVEINEALGPQTLSLFTETPSSSPHLRSTGGSGLTAPHLLQDLSGRDRFVLTR